MSTKKTVGKLCSFCGEEKTSVVISRDGNSFICSECIEKSMRLLEEDTHSHGTPSKVSPLEYTPMTLKMKLDEYIVGQDEVKKILCVAVCNHYKRLVYNLQNNSSEDVEIEKSNILLVGPSGSGKTLIASTLAKLLNLPFAIADATTLTEAGYVGDDVENILLKLIQNAQYDLERASRGIIFIDEIDKISRKGQSTSITRDVSGEGVQQALLKIIEGTEATVPPMGGRKHPQGNNLKINTKDILFICGGAFVGLDDIVRSRMNSSGIGFNAEIKGKKEVDAVIENTTHDDLIRFGLIPELIGRLSVQGFLKELGDLQLKEILTKPKNAILKQYYHLLKLDNVDLEYDESFLNEVVRTAKGLKTGARGLRSVLEKIMIDIMYKLPDPKIKKVSLTKRDVPKVGDKVFSDGVKKKNIA